MTDRIHSANGKMAVKFQAKWALLCNLFSTPAQISTFDIAVLLFGAGIGVYFALPYEPEWVWLFVALLVGAGVFRLIPETRHRARFFLLLSMCVIAGVGRAAWHTKAAATPKMPAYERSYHVTGWVESIDKVGTRPRWILRVTEIEGRDTAETPFRIRLTTYKNEIAAGETVKIRAVLNAPPIPVISGGYDGARRAYFSKVGAYGYAISLPEKLAEVRLSPPDALKRKIVRMRFSLAERIRSKAPERTAGLQVALLTGIRAHIPEAHTDTLRNSGLAHVLAISGLHMGLFAGGMYALATFLLACIIPLSRRIDVRKLAAVVGALAAAVYLTLSGASVATQRAFIMTIIVFLAVLLDRRAFSLRSVSLAAFVTLMFHPEALVSAGFQMSFSAVIALVVVYRTWDLHRSYDGIRPSFFDKLKRGFAMLTVTSLVAGTATAGYAAIHFNRMATYGLGGNLIAMPVFTAWVMPAAIAVMLAIPFGLEELPLKIMSLGLVVVLEAGSWVAELAGAVTYVPSPPAWLVGVFSIAFGLLCLGGLRIRTLGLGLMIACFAGWNSAPHPVIRVSDTGAVAFWSDAADGQLVVDGARRDRFGRNRFLQKIGDPEADTESIQRVAPCDKYGCRFKVKDTVVSIIHHPAEAAEACHTSALVILTQRTAGPRVRRQCAAKLLDQNDYGQYGAQDIYIDGSSIKAKAANPPARQNRPWG